MSEPDADPYAPPDAAVADVVRRPPGSALLAIVLGVIIDVGGTVASGTLIGTAYAVYTLATGGPKTPEALQAGIEQMTMLRYAESAIGLGFSVLGGYVCARMARRPSWRVGIGLAVVTAMAGVALSWPINDPGRFAALTLVGVGATFLGLALGNRAVKRRG